MSIFLQEFRDEGMSLLEVTRHVLCRNCNIHFPVTGSFEVENGHSVLDADISEAITEEMNHEGWERKNCPVCVNTIPDLIKIDIEEEESA